MLPPNQFVKQIIESWDQLELSNHPVDLREEGREIVRPDGCVPRSVQTAPSG